MPETIDPTILLACAGLLIGFLLGVTIIYSQFCTMGAVADIAISQHYGRMRSWLLAIVIAISGTQLAAAYQLLALEQTLYLQSHLYWLGAIIGGLLFGFGMVIACGCGARSIAMSGSGDLRALVALIVLGIVAYMTMRGIFAVPRSWFYRATVIDSSAWLATPSLHNALAILLNISEKTSRVLGVLAIAVPILWFIFKDPEFRASPKRIIAGITVGLLVLAGWLATGWILNDEFEETPPESLTFIAPVGDSLQYLMIWTGTSITFGVAVVGGLLIGGWATSLYRKEFYFRGFEDAAEMGRYMGGGALMGMGGALAGGCTFGQGISGVSTLSLMSFLSLASIIIGAFIGVRYLEQGSIIAALQKMWRL